MGDLITYTGKHPIVTGQFVIKTPAIKDMRKTLGQWFDCGLPGGVVTAPSRYGKSWSIEDLSKRPIGGPGMPFVSTQKEREVKYTMNQFYRKLLFDFGHKDPNNGDSFEKAERLANYLASLAANNFEESIFIVVDDAQELEDQELFWLCNLYDALIKRKVRGFFALFAEPIFIGRRDTWRNRGKTQIVGRFLTIDYTFESVTTAEQMKECLREYDEVLDYPVGSGWTYSRNYFTEAYDSQRFRLNQQAELLFQAFREVHEKSQVSWGFVIPMQYLCSAVKYNFLKNKNTTASFDGFSYDDWIESVMFSGYINAGSYLTTAKKWKRASY